MPHCLLTSLCCHSAWWLSARVWRLNSLSWMDLGTLPASVYTRLSALKYSDGDVKYLFEDSAMPGRIPRSLPSTCTYTHTCIPLFLCCQSRSWRMRLWRKDVGGLFLWVEGIIWAEWNNKKKITRTDSALLMPTLWVATTVWRTSQHHLFIRRTNKQTYKRVYYS